MGMTLYLNVRDGDEYDYDDNDRSALLELEEPLEAIAAELNVTPLSGFYDDTDCRCNLDEDFVGSAEDGEGWTAADAQWYPAADLLASMTALLAHLESDPDVLPETNGWDQQAALEDLREFMELLKPAVAAGKTVHLQMIM